MLMEDLITTLREEDESLIDMRFERIKSLEFLKGISICLLIIIELSSYWLSEDWLFIYAIMHFILDFLAGNFLIFLSIVSVVFSMKKRLGFFPEISIRNIIMKRALLILVLGVGYNIISNPSVPFPMNLWGWNLLMIIGFGQFLTYFLLHVARGFRSFIGAVIILFTPQIRELLYLFKDNSFLNIFHYILISPFPVYPVVPYISLIIFSTVFGEYFLEAVFLDVKKAFIEIFQYFLKYGTLFLFLGLYLGYRVVSQESFPQEEYPVMEAVPFVLEQEWFKIEGTSGFFIRGSSANMFYTIGMILIVSGIGIYLIDIKHLERSNIRPYVDVFSFYGRAAFSLFIMFHVGRVLFYQSLDIFIFWPAIISLLGLLGYIMYLWKKYARGILTIEWIMSKIGPLTY